VAVLSVLGGAGSDGGSFLVCFSLDGVGPTNA